MDFYWILIVFVFGFALKQIGLPPMIGYLIAGFAMNAYGIQPINNIETLANLGITLLLFTIGLKVRVKDLTDKVVLGGAIGPMILTTVLVGVGCLAIGTVVSVSLFDLSWQTAALIGFALSFSSTVCVAKILEETGELKTRHGKISIGILVIQDFAAVIFLVAALGTLPSLWALALILLIPARQIFGKLLTQAGHGELLPLIGFCFAFGGYELFYAVDLKGDLGALIAGMLLSSHAKSNELYKSLMNFKDLFLIGFFISIGFTALPSLETFTLAIILVALIPAKFVIFFYILAKLKLRARTSFLTAMALMNFSEFGLIVAKICVDKNWLAADWLVAIAIAVTLSFVISSFVFKHAHLYFSRYKKYILKYEAEQTVNNTCPNMPTTAEVLVIGMGRVGSGSYDALAEELGDKVWGIDADSDRIEKHQNLKRKVALADAEDIEFWEQVDLSQVKLVMLALPSLADMKNVIMQLKLCQYQGQIAAIAQYADEGEILIKYGAHTVFNYHKEIGAGFAKESMNLLNKEEERLNLNTL
ncbi:cation:proton antiporter family protein [Catenovulum sediminis]|uniref:Cation:proton antiporter family protein n=1 Tax=Catenovulum sediminis TaxID=1740262 RepID=A0ABV1RC08_9ALTE|nr:cation:proton antiporter family protein [Catenovulum sediminis]